MVVTSAGKRETKARWRRPLVDGVLWSYWIKTIIIMLYIYMMYVCVCCYIFDKHNVIWYHIKPCQSYSIFRRMRPFCWQGTGLSLMISPLLRQSFLLSWLSTGSRIPWAVDHWGDAILGANDITIRRGPEWKLDQGYRTYSFRASTLWFRIDIW